MLFCQQTQKTHSYYHSVTAELPFILTRIGRMHQTRPSKGVLHATICYYTLIVYQVYRATQFNSCCTKLINFISPELWPQQARTEFSSLQDLWSL